jgi:hypothetical protein
MRQFQRWLESLTRSWWKFLLVLLANAASFFILFRLEDAFEARTGVAVLDTQNDLTLPSLLEQLPLYKAEALGDYWRFAAFDFVFPFVAALFLAVLWALLLRLNPAPWLKRPQFAAIPLLAFVVTVFDYLENIGFILTLLLVPNPPTWIIEMALLFKKLKLFGLACSGGLTGLLFLALIFGFVFHHKKNSTL